MIHAFLFPDAATTSTANLPERPRQALDPANTPLEPPPAAARAAVRGAPRSNIQVQPLNGPTP